MALTQWSLTFVILVAAMVAATPTTPTSSSCPERLFGLHVSASRNATGHNNMKARLEQPEDSNWHLDMTAEERGAATGGGRKRITTFVLAADPDAAWYAEEEEDKKGLRRLVKDLQQQVRELKEAMAANNAMLEAAVRGKSTAATPTPTLRSLTTEERNALSRRLLEEAKKGRVGEVRWLLSRGADVNYKDGHSRAALYWAAYYGHSEALQLLIDAGAPLDAVEHIRQTALLAAAYFDHVASVAALVSAGADMDIPGNEGRTPLQWAAAQGNELSVRIMVEAGANTTIRDNHGRTALDLAANQATRALLALRQ